MKKILSLLLLIPGILAVMSVSASCQKSRETAPALVSPLVATEGQAVSDSAQQVSSEAAITTGQKEQDGTTLIYKCDMKKMIAAPLWRSVKKSFVEADSLNADYMLIHMNTYGGQVDIADSMRTLILNYDIPVIVFIDNQAISAGALIAVAADSIYMRRRRWPDCQ